MQANHAVGEIGLSLGDTDALFRPSLLAMSRLGSPAYIVEAYARIVEPATEDWQIKSQFSAALHIITCCAVDDTDIDPLIGYYDGHLRYVPGALPPEDILTIARHLMRHGVSGVSPNRDEPLIKGKPMTEFEASQFAAMATAHLGMPESAAWNLTMTGLLAALHSKFPPDKNSAASITEKQYKDNMDWLARINKLRDKKHG